MGNCCKKGLLQKLDNNTEIYTLCSDSQAAKAKLISITLEGDLYLLCPDKHQLIETDEIFKYKDGMLALLKDQTGIKTGEHCIKNCFF
jgi:hypothetical protein